MQRQPGQREFWRLAVPNILANLAIPMAALADAAFLGHLDEVAPLAGVALAALIFDYLYWTFNFLRMSTTGTTAMAVGAGDLENSASIFCQSFLLAMALGLLIVSLQAPIGDFGFYLLQGGPAVESEGRAYFSARIWGAPAALGGFVILGWLLGHGRSRAAMIYALILNGLNVTLDWWFIVGLGWGSRGAGLATLVSEWTAFCCGLFMVIRAWRGHPPPGWKLVSGSWQRAGDLLKLQANIMVRSFCLITAFALFTNLSAVFGAVVLAGNALLLKLLGMASYFIDGFAFALETLAGTYAGRNNAAAVRRALSMSLGWNLLAVGAFAGVFALHGDWVLGLLTKHAAVVDSAVAFIPYLCAVLLIAGFAYIYDGFYFGLAHGRLLRTSMLWAFLTGFAPLVLAAVHWRRPALLWWAMIAFMAVRSLTLGARARRALEDLETAAVLR